MNRLHAFVACAVGLALVVGTGAFDRLESAPPSYQHNDGTKNQIRRTTTAEVSNQASGVQVNPPMVRSLLASMASGAGMQNAGSAVVRFDIANVTGTPRCTWDGTWQSNWGSIVLQQVGDSVWGTYTHDAGRIAGRVAGSKFVGVWSESPSYSPSRDAGDMELEMSADCRSFVGRWRYGIGGTSWSGDWNGSRVGFSVTGRIMLNGKGVAGVEVAAGSLIGVTDANGYFTLNGVAAGTIALTPRRQGLTFQPSSSNVEVGSSNVVDVNFTATASGGVEPGDGCEKVIASKQPSWNGGYYPTILTGSNAIATAREPNGKIHVLYYEAPGYIYHKSSVDNGVTWSAPNRIESEPNASGSNSLLIGPDGVLHAGNQFNVGAYYTRSTDGGATWTAPMYLHDQGWGDWDYGAHLAFDTQGRLHAVYYAAYGWDDPPFNIKHRISTDGGLTWDAEENITTIPNESSRGSGASAPCLVAGPDGLLYLAYWVQTSVEPSRYTLVLRRWSGWPWGEEVVVEEGIVTPNGVDLAVDASGVLHIVYAAGVKSAEPNAIQMVYRTFTNGTVGARRQIGDESNVWYAPSIGFANGKTIVVTGTLNHETQRGAGIYAYNVSDNWQCPTLVSKTNEAMVANIPWTYYDRRPANTFDVTWIEQYEDRAELVICDLASLQPKPCSGKPFTEGPSAVASDSIDVSITSITTDAVGNPPDFPVVDLVVSVAEARQGLLGDLTRENFEIHEDGVYQQFAMISRSASKPGENEPAAAIVVVDGSNGVPDSTKTKIAELLRGVAENMKPNWRISVVRYADRVQTMADFSNNAIDLISAGLAPGPSGEEAVIMSAITESVDRVARQPEVYKTVVVLTSGRITDPQFAAFAIKNAVTKGVPVFVLGVTDIKADPTLRSLAERSGGRIYTQGDDLDDVNETSAATLGNAYRIRYTTTNQKRDGSSRNVKVTLRAPRKDTPTTVVTDTDAKTYRAPVNTTEAVVAIDGERVVIPPAPQTVTVPVSVRNITDTRGLLGAQVTIEFDPSSVELVGQRPGEFLSPPPLDILSDLSSFSEAASGRIVLNVVRVGGSPAGVQGSGPLYYLTFRARTASARTTLHIASISLRNAQNLTMPARSRDGELVSALTPDGPGAGVASVFTNVNDADARSGAALPATFQINEPHVITRVQTLHADGKTAGTISLVNSQTGQTLGPWQATGSRRGATDNAVWTVDINETLPPGVYDVVDSDPVSWTHNPESNFRGICWVDGKKVNSDKPTDHRGVLLGDFDGSNAVDFKDYTLFVSYWNVTERKGDLASPITGDLPGVPPFMVETYPYRPDGIVNFEDQIVFAQMYNWTRGIGKPGDAETTPRVPLRLRVSDVALISGEREIQIDGISAEHLLGVNLSLTAHHDMLNGIRMNVGSLFANDRMTPSAFFDTRSGEIRASVAGLSGRDDGVNGSGGIVRIRYRPHPTAPSPRIADVDARDVLNRRVEVLFETEDVVNAPISLVPNPASSSVMITVWADGQGIATVHVADVSGRTVATWVMQTSADGVASQTKDISTLPQGTYMVTVEVGGHRATAPLTILR